MGHRKTQHPIYGYSVCLKGFHRKVKFKLHVKSLKMKLDNQMIMMGRPPYHDLAKAGRLNLDGKIKKKNFFFFNILFAFKDQLLGHT